MHAMGLHDRKWCVVCLRIECDFQQVEKYIMWNIYGFSLLCPLMVSKCYTYSGRWLLHLYFSFNLFQEKKIVF